jgi:hypothetical protein
MKFVAYIELVIFMRVLLGALTFQNSLISPVIYGHFLRQRYYQSSFTRDAVAVTNAKIDRWVRAPGRPPMLVTVWVRLQMILERWVGNTLAPSQNGTAGQRRWMGLADAVIAHSQRMMPRVGLDSQPSGSVCCPSIISEHFTVWPRIRIRSAERATPHGYDVDQVRGI